MPKPATGNVRWVKGVPVARAWLTDTARPSFVMPTCTTEAEASERAKLLVELAKRMRAARRDPEHSRKILEEVAAASQRSLRQALAVAKEFLEDKLGLETEPSVPTFKEIGEQWTSGELAKRYPDQIRVKRSAKADVSRLETHIYPHIGDRRVDHLTLDDFENVMAAIPQHLEVATRRNIGQLMTRLMTMCVYPLRLIRTNPIPRGFLPTKGPRKAFGYLYPSDDARLMACKAVPLEFRLLWGFLTREGLRDGEAVQLTVTDFDLERGAVRLDDNKTNDPRSWALNPSVAAALRRYLARYRPSIDPTELVFVDPQGRQHIQDGNSGLPNKLRAHLRAIGLHKSRPELFTTSDQRQQIRAHDLRASFVTVALANGRSETWVADRTGHKSSAMINRYRRLARTFQELHVGDFEPLDTAIPELANGHGMDTGATGLKETAMISETYLRAGNGIRKPVKDPQGTEIAKLPQETGGHGQPSEPIGSARVHSVSIQDPVEQALADAIGRAVAAEQWRTVDLLTRELTARRDARVGVVDLATERMRRRP